jgi:hypothetical protein
VLPRRHKTGQKRSIYQAKSTRPIKAGEQLFLNYGASYFENDEKVDDFK